MTYTFTLENRPEVSISLPRVTEICGVLDKPGLQWWYAKLPVQAIARFYKEDPEFAAHLHDPDEIHAYLKAKKATPWFESRRAMDRGQYVHGALENYVKTGNPGTLDPEFKGYVTAGMKWWDSTEREVVGVETTLYSLRHGYAGTADLLYRTIPDGEVVQAVAEGAARGPAPVPTLTIADWKTSKSDYDSHHFQLAGYAGAWEEMTGDPVAKTEIILLGEDGNFRVVEGRAGFDDFLAVLDVWKRVQGLKNGGGA